jgi:hypothetical protein
MAAHYPVVRGVGAFGFSAASITNHIIGGTSGISEDGDLILIFLHSANQAFTAPAGGGYLALPSSPQSTGAAGVGGGVRLTIFYKISNGTETTYVTGDSGDINVVGSLVIGNVDRINPINVTAGGVSAANATITWSSVTTTRPECMIINAAAFDRDANSEPFISAITNANLANITQRYNRVVSTQSGGGLGVWTSQKGTIGATGATTGTQPAPTAAYTQITFAIAPLRRRIAVT